MSYEVRMAGFGSVPAPNVAAELRSHPQLQYQNGCFIGQADIPEEFIEQDIRFTLENNIPAENTASRLETYQPHNSTQDDLLDKATFLANMQGRFMGLFALGSAGVGKSHVAIGLAKKLELEGQKSRYVHVPSARLMLKGGEPNLDETIILDDLNEPFGWGRQHFSKIVTSMHHNGSGRLFITSNVAPGAAPEFIKNMIGSSPDNAEFIRISDRIGAAMRLIAVDGSSYRRSRQEDPWADYGDFSPSKSSIDPPSINS